VKEAEGKREEHQHKVRQGVKNERERERGQTDFGWEVIQLVVGQAQGGDLGWV